MRHPLKFAGRLFVFSLLPLLLVVPLLFGGLLSFQSQVSHESATADDLDTAEVVLASYATD